MKFEMDTCKVVHYSDKSHKNQTKDAVLNQIVLSGWACHLQFVFKRNIAFQSSQLQQSINLILRKTIEYSFDILKETCLKLHFEVFPKLCDLDSMIHKRRPINNSSNGSRYTIKGKAHITDWSMKKVHDKPKYGCILSSQPELLL